MNAVKILSEYKQQQLNENNVIYSMNEFFTTDCVALTESIIAWGSHSWRQVCADFSTKWILFSSLVFITLSGVKKTFCRVTADSRHLTWK